MPDKIGQISRTVSDITAASQWYADVLGLPHLYTFGTLAFFDCQGTRLMLTQNETLNTNESILYFMTDDILQGTAALKAQGVAFLSEPQRIHVHEDGTEEWMAFFRDPDNRPLALMSRTPPQSN
jgi:catechol 2,3-dioxygenase-like lactoylglutathione lyase family enzyme